MSEKKDFTFKQLAQIALGGSKLNNLQISLLHTIINLALKKLNCENEKVTLCGTPADNIKKLQQKSTSGPVLILDERNMKTPMKEYEKLAELEEKTKILECQLDKHLAVVNFSINSDPPCWAGCDVDEENDETIKALRLSKWFLDNLNDRLSKPVWCRFNKIKSNLNKLVDEIEVFKEDCAEAYEKMNVVEDLQDDLADLRNAINENRKDFDTSMIEIQGLLNFKENNCDVLPVKASFREMITKATKDAIEATRKNTTPQALAFYSTIGLMDSPVPILDKPKSMELLTRKSGKNVCDCDKTLFEEQIPLPERIKNMDLSKVLRQNTSGNRCSFFRAVFNK